jgi:periplasmic divalent cation tolerance protein
MYILILSSFPNEETAASISRELVENKLIACANIIQNVKSVYRWKEEIEESAEALVLFKTTKANFQKVKAHLLKEHPYELPEIISFDISEAYEPYLKWILKELHNEK